jgi:tetratricopeptide (TPR) repeat protein
MFLILMCMFCCSLLLPGTSGAQGVVTAEEVFQQANDLYKQREYNRAAEKYSQLLEKGYESASLYYNLGNCHFKQGRLGMAIADYLRGQRLNPRNPDIQLNLRYARTLQVDQEFTRPERSFTGQLFQSLKNDLTLGEILVLALVLFWLFCAALLVRIVKPEWTVFRSIRTGFLILYLLVGLLAVSKYRDVSQSRAVVIAPEAEATSGPDAGTTLFTLHEGTTGRVQRRQEQWVQIALPNGLSGWVQRDEVEVI